MPDSFTTPQHALGYARRRLWIFAAWWYGSTLAVTGAVHALTSLALGSSAETGTFLFAFGAVLSMIGWLVTAAARWTRKPPRPTEGIARAEQTVRVTPGAAIGGCVLIWAIVAALAFLTPKGLSPDTLPILTMFAAYPAYFAAGMAYQRWVLQRREPLYARWLIKHGHAVSMARAYAGAGQSPSRTYDS